MYVGRVEKMAIFFISFCTIIMRFMYLENSPPTPAIVIAHTPPRIQNMFI